MKYVNTTLAPTLYVNADDYNMSYSSFVYYQDKETQEWKEYQTLYGEVNRIWVDIEDVPDACGRQWWPSRTSGSSSTTAWTGSARPVLH